MKTVQEWLWELGVSASPIGDIDINAVETIQRDAFIHGLKEALQLMSQEESIDLGPGKILRKIEELEKGKVLDRPESEAHRENV